MTSRQWIFSATFIVQVIVNFPDVTFVMPTFHQVQVCLAVSFLTAFLVTIFVEWFFNGQ